MGNQSVKGGKINKQLQLVKIYRIQVRVSCHLTNFSDHSQLGIQEDEMTINVKYNKENNFASLS